jgi:hypothetical protein
MGQQEQPDTDEFLRPPKGVIRAVESCARWLLALSATLAPRHYWLAWEERLPIGQAVLVSALLTTALGLFIGYEGFLSYALRANAAAREALGASGSEGVTEQYLMGFGTISLIAFVFFTPTGWLAVYLCLSGAARIVGVAANSPFGDPLLTLLDWGVRSRRHEVRDRRARLSREEAEGPEVPDVIVNPEALRMHGCDLVVVASRRKAGWEQGAFILDGERTYRIGVPAERHYPAGLRTLYPLTRVDSLEALRRWVRYEVPPPGSPDSLLAPRAIPHPPSSGEDR